MVPNHFTSALVTILAMDNMATMCLGGKGMHFRKLWMIEVASVRPVVVFVLKILPLLTSVPYPKQSWRMSMDVSIPRDKPYFEKG